MTEPIDLAALKQQTSYGYGYAGVIQQLIAAIEAKDAALRGVEAGLLAIMEGKASVDYVRLLLEPVRAALALTADPKGGQ